MNKTININLAKQLFHVDEDAYVVLKSYTQELRNRFVSEQGADDIMFDVEARMAELFTLKMKPTNEQVVSLEYANEVIMQLGNMDEYEDAPKEKIKSSTTDNYAAIDRGRVFFRDPTNKIAGGVLSGAAHYFGFKEALWLRLGVAAAFILAWQADVAFLIGATYILLWVILPEAFTTLDRMRMKGNPLTVDEIEKNFKNEYEDLTKRMNSTLITQRFGGLAGQLINGLLWALLSIFKVIGFILAGIVLAVLISLFFGLNKLSFAGLNMADFFDANQSFWGYVTYWGLLLVITIPMLALLFSISKTVFQFKFENRYLTASSVVVWIVGVVFLLLGGSQISAQFDEKAKTNSRQAIYNANSDTLYIGYDKPKDENFIGLQFGKTTIYGSTILYRNIDFDIQPSPNDSAYFLFKKSARGKDYQSAFNQATEIEYSILQNDSLFTMPAFFTVTNAKKYRAQKLSVVLHLPIGKSVYLNNNITPIINDINNSSNTFDDDMVGKYWTMTPNGLTNKIEESKSIQAYKSSDKSKKNDNSIEINGNRIKLSNQNNNGKNLVILNGDTIINSK